MPVRRSPRIAMILVSLCAIVCLGLFQQKAWRQCADREQSMPERFIARYQPMRGRIPKTEAVRFVLDENHVDLNLAHADARLFFAQYALSPQQVGRNVNSPWVIVDSEKLDGVPEIAAKEHWTLVADLRNGVRLYRTDARK